MRKDMRNIIRACIVLDTVIILISLIAAIINHRQESFIACGLYAVITVLAIYELYVVNNI